MTYCPSCKVSLAPGAEKCPLCQGQSVESSSITSDEILNSSEVHRAVTYSPDIRNADEKEKLTPAEKRLMVFELLAVSFGIMLIVTLGIDILTARGITWSRYTSLILVTGWLFCAMPLILWGHPWLVYAVLGPSLLISVFLWALCSNALLWFVITALPLTLLLEATVVSSSVLVSIQKRKGMNSVGVILGAAVFLCAGIDLVLGYSFRHILALTWSVIVIVAVLPVAGFFFYLHYRVIKQASLRKIFRL